MNTLLIQSAAVLGVDAHPVRVEIDVSWGMPTFQIVGLPDGAVRESRDRVRSAIKNSGYDFPEERVTINLAPADLKKVGSGYDLPIALGILGASGNIPEANMNNYMVAAELGLDGRLRPIRGILPVATLALNLFRNNQCAGLIVAQGNEQEAAIVHELPVHSAGSLEELVQGLVKASLPTAISHFDETSDDHNNTIEDFRDVKGHQAARRALEVAAAGGHNVMMVGPPGSGKTMLAKRMAGILPPLNFDEALATTKIHSVAGILRDGQLVRQRPFRAPHHSISDAGLIGGGSVPRPGEVSLAHNGVLFLDELPEFRKHVLEVLRQPLEDQQVTLARAAISLTFPARIMLVAAMNPSPSGDYDAPKEIIDRYMGRISGPLMDRLDLQIQVPAVRYEELANRKPGEDSTAIRQRVATARSVQADRFGRSMSNADMGPAMIQQYCEVTRESEQLLRRAVETFGMSARGYARILKMARTIADLEESTDIATPHIAEAIQYRNLDRSR